MDYKLRQTDAEVLICDGAKVCGDVSLAPGVSVWYNAVLRGDEGAISVGEGTNIQDCAVLHEETRVGAGCAIGDNVLIGMGAIVLNGARIGNDSVVGAGSLVTGKLDAPAGSMILGSPAKVVRPLTEAEIEANRQSAQGYQELAKRCRQG